MDPDTNEPTDDLTPQAASLIAAKGSSATKISQIIDNQDQAVFTAIQEGIDRANAKAISNAATVCVIYCIMHHQYRNNFKDELYITVTIILLLYYYSHIG